MLLHLHTFKDQVICWGTSINCWYCCSPHWFTFGVWPWQRRAQNSALPTFDRSRSWLSRAHPRAAHSSSQWRLSFAGNSRSYFPLRATCNSVERGPKERQGKLRNIQYYIAIYWDRISNKWWTSNAAMGHDWISSWDYGRLCKIFCTLLQTTLQRVRIHDAALQASRSAITQRRGSLFSVCAWCISKALCSFVARAVGLNSLLGHQQQQQRQHRHQYHHHSHHSSFVRFVSMSLCCHLNGCMSCWYEQSHHLHPRASPPIPLFLIIALLHPPLPVFFPHLRPQVLGCPA